MEKITKSLVKELNEAVRNDDCQSFFEALGFHLYDLEDGRYELSGVHTDGGVEMCLTIEKDNWIEDFEDYYEGFDVDEEISLYRENPDSEYCRRFSCRESVEDFEDWDNYIKQLVDIATAGGDYKYHKILYHNIASRILLFSKSDYQIDKLDKLDDDELMDMAYTNSSGSIQTLSVDEFFDGLNSNQDFVKEYYVKPIAG